jgi:two-component system cell cycle sensor histidine kinase/response regulator CckA
MARPIHILLVEDREDDAILITRALSRANLEPLITRVETEEQMRGALSSARWDVILSDYMLPKFSCHRALEILQESGADIPFISISGTVSEETILTALRAGARDYVMKDNLARLPSAIEREMREAENRKQRRRLEAQLQQAGKMEAIGRLAGGVAHDFNNLLTVISGFAQLALLDENPAQAGLEQILLAAERATQLTRQLLAFSRQQTLAPKVFDLNRLVTDMEPMLQRLLGENIQMTFRSSPEPVDVKADPGQMEQVLLNLVINASDAMPGGGKLVVSTSRRTLEGKAAEMQGLSDGEYCVLSVSDTGEGIPPEAFPHIFEPFFTTKPEGKGTGLGLATVYGVLQQSGGAIHAYSEKGFGTSMICFIPRSGAGVQPEKSVNEAPLASGTETVLVAEDDATVLRIVADSLEARGFKVLMATSAEEALQILRQRHSSNQGTGGVDLMISDVVMPGMAGPVLADKAAEFMPNLRVLFMSGYTEDAVRHDGLVPGERAFIQKPFAPGDLVRKVRTLLDAGKTPAQAKAMPAQGFPA